MHPLFRLGTGSEEDPRGRGEVLVSVSELGLALRFTGLGPSRAFPGVQGMVMPGDRLQLNSHP